MRKAQVFTLDLFSAYSIFLVVMLVLTVISAQMMVSMNEIERNDRVHSRVIAAQDYLCTSGEFTDAPYKFNKDAIEAFFAQSDEQVSERLNFGGLGYSIKIIQISGNVVKLSRGSDAEDHDYAAALTRIVRYKSQDHRLVVVLWKKGTI